MKRHRRIGGMLCALACGLALLGTGLFGQAGSAHADTSLFYGFEDGSDGFTAPSWLGANAGQPTQSSAQHSEGANSLALPVSFTGGSWDQAGVDKVIDNYNPVDLSAYSAITYDVYSPVANVSTDLVFNDPWLPAANPKPLQVGWNTVTFDISPTSQDFPNAGNYFTTAKEFLLRAIGRGATYSGPVYFDNVRFVPTTQPVIRTAAPQADDVLSVPQGQTYTIQAHVTPSIGRQISSVTFKTATQSGTLTFDSANNIYTGAWDLWKEGDGLKTLTISATDSTGATTTSQTSVLVQDSQLQVHITTPTFDQQLKGKVTVSAQVKADPRFALKSVKLQAAGQTVPMTTTAAGVYAAELNTHELQDGVQTFKVVVRDARFTVSDLVDVLVANHDRPANIVHANKTRFVDGHTQFRYVGWNEYDLFTRTDQTVAHNEQTSEGNILLKGTVIPWQQQIDRQMLEAERNGLSVLRTWAFDSSADSSAFETGPGQYNEATFQKLDYIMASAQRHHMRVILTMDNYWGDYGGIQQETKWLGLTNKLQFFTDPQAKALYQQYVAHLVNRVNTVTGVAYKNDPTVFAWELMNEPRVDCSDDPTPMHQYCDPSGNTLRNWVDMMSKYVKGLDPQHMVTDGFEGHSFVPTGPNGKGIQWGGTQEGNGNSPVMAQDVPGIDFFTFHPYPNASWANLTLEQTRQLITGITKAGLQRGKPVVMEEYGIDRAQPVYDPSGKQLQPSDPAYAATRVTWYKDMLDTFYRAGGAGSNIWQLADWSDNNYNVNPYLPQADAQRDAPLMAVLAREARQLADD
ncbi:glycoside hydrolase 5 family protein [Dictyobacter kobayashii]|uniref:mannan endo-1,4-beta-mannosidase n=1 Tax=Dictyobacter kobayashii TaxID=2014872 RepID=A0A402AQZ9_9CHLR|nr:Ig-like domain-containing protein [Dictyobacter kobayashii]GCE21521.1 hypothetical protein KDK_53210 [Dictyobacter kobayashii]